MSKFLTLYNFNLKRMNKSLLFWIFTLIAVVGVPIGLHQFTKDWDPAIYQLNSNYNNQANDTYNVGFFILFIAYFFTVFCGATITNSIANERISKVSDLLTYHISPVKIVYSKIFALFTLLVEALALIVGSCFVCQNTGFIHFEKINFFINAIGISGSKISVILISACVAIFVYTLLYAMVGICITNQQQMQFAQLPVTLILIAAFVTSYVCLNNPDLLLSKIMYYVPFVSPFLLGNGILNNSISFFQLGFAGISFIFLIGICNIFIIKILIPKKMI